MIHHYITRSGIYKKIKVKGTNRDKDIAVKIKLSEGQRVYIDRIECSEVFIALIVEGEGHVHIGTLEVSSYGGDVADLWTSNVHIDRLYWGSNKPTRPYEKYHQDVVQIDLLDINYESIDGVIGNIVISEMDGELSGKEAACITLSGKARNTNMRFGTDKLFVKMGGYKHLVNAYQLDSSVIGGDLVSVGSADVFIKNRKNRNKHDSFNLSVSSALLVDIY